MFNVWVPGFRVGFADDPPGFDIDENGLPRQRYGGPRQTRAPVDSDSPRAAGYDLADSSSMRFGIDGTVPAYVPGPGGDGSGDKYDKCTLLPGTQQFGFCLYRCPDGTIRRDYEVLGCRPWIYRFQGFGL
jgi:hypothetical protein